MTGAAPLVLAHLALLGLFDLAASPWATLGVLGAAYAAHAWAALRLERTAGAATVLAGAVLLRALLLPLPPTLSDDVRRYVWDGRVVAAGENPYRLAPDAGELAPLRDGSWSEMPHRGVATVYPPLALGLFRLAAELPAPIAGLKILLAAGDLAVCVLLLRLARLRGLPPGRTLWYAWSPLATVEVAGMGHVDALGVAAAVAAALLVTTRRPALAGAAAAAGILAKLAPLAALPMWARQSARPVRCAVVALALVVAATIPVVVSTRGVPPGLVAYGVSWEFNGPLYEPLWRLYDRAGTEAWLKARLDAAKERSGEHERWNRVYPFVYPQLLAKATLAIAAAGVVALSLRWRDAVVGSGRLFAALLLASATVYPWYLLWVLPWAALARHPAWLLAPALVQLSYLPQLVGLPLWPGLFAAIWVPVGVTYLHPRGRWSIAS